MPQGPISAEQVFRGEVTFFSLDTDLIQSAGFDFGAGALHQLPKQLPKSMRLQITEVVVQEIVRHRMKPVSDAIAGFTRASQALTRLCETQMAPIDQSFAALAVADAAAARFREEVVAYAAQCRGGVLPIFGGDLASEVFKRYFRDEPPFADSRARKAEFPDATSLVLLERFAREHDTCGVVASGDAAWTAFAKSSDRLYAVTSIDDLATLFAATSAHATALKTKLLTSINDPRSALRARLDSALAEHVAEAEWDTGEVFSGSGRVEAEVTQVELNGYRWDGALIDVWPIEEDPMTWVVEIIASVRAIVHADVNFFVWDSIDREELSIGYNTVSLPTEVEVTAYLNCGNVELDAEIEEWQVEPEIARGSYSLGEVEIEPDFRDRD